jgi:hypothetical protein
MVSIEPLLKLLPRHGDSRVELGQGWVSPVFPFPIIANSASSNLIQGSRQDVDDV